VIAFLTAKGVPTCLLPYYESFFATFVPTEQTVNTLKVLLEFAISINADMTWIARLEKPGPVIVEEAWGIITDEQLHLYSTLCMQRKFFSASYF
jgi:hypothetical protein